MKTMLFFAVIAAALLGIALLMRKRTPTATHATSQPATLDTVTAAQAIAHLADAAAMARATADPTDEEWFPVSITGMGGGYTYETAASAARRYTGINTGTSAALVTRLRRIVAVNTKAAALLRADPAAAANLGLADQGGKLYTQLPLTATDQDVTEFEIQVAEETDAYLHPPSTSLGFLGTGLNMIGSLFDDPRLGSQTQGLVSLST
jgi:hypothetical protein